MNSNGHLFASHCRIVENVEIAKATFRLRFECPDLANRLLPGQFVMVRLADSSDPLIGRALAMFDRFRDDQGAICGIDVVYVVKGKFTQTLSKKQNGEVFVWGPLGNTFDCSPVDHLILVAGGVGQTPMLSVAKEALGLETFGDQFLSVQSTRLGFADKVSLCYGARSARYLAGVKQFEEAGIELHLSTDDGSIGHHGLVTDTLRALLENAPAAQTRILCCGPEPMMEAVSKVANNASVQCQVSLETPMACGIGICFTCVTRVRVNSVGECPEDAWDYRRTCIEGPIFDAQDIVW